MLYLSVHADFAEWCESKKAICNIWWLEKSTRDSSWTWHHTLRIYNNYQLLFPRGNCQVASYIIYKTRKLFSQNNSIKHISLLSIISQNRFNISIIVDSHSLNLYIINTIYNFSIIISISFFFIFQKFIVKSSIYNKLFFMQYAIICKILL